MTQHSLKVYIIIYYMSKDYTIAMIAKKLKNHSSTILRTEKVIKKHFGINFNDANERSTKTAKRIIEFSTMIVNEYQDLCEDLVEIKLDNESEGNNLE